MARHTLSEIAPIACEIGNIAIGLSYAGEILDRDPLREWAKSLMVLAEKLDSMVPAPKPEIEINPETDWI